MNNAPRYFIYVRKSTNKDEQQIRSIGDQLAEVQELVRKHDLAVVDVIAENQSAKTKGRPLFNEMLDRVEAGHADGIIAWHPDRLARNALDGGRVIDLLDEGKLRDLKFCSFWFENTAQGKLMLNLAFGQSKYHSDSFRDGVKRAQRQKTSQGIWSWKAPVGYLNEPKLRTIVPDPVTAPIVRKAFELYASGHYTILCLTDVLCDAGLKGQNGGIFSVSRCQHLLKNPFYYGLFRLHAQLHQGAHAPLITRQLFDKCQEVMKRRSKPQGPRLKPYVYRGLLHCGECGCVVTMETHKGHNYLRCTKRVKRDCSQPYLREERLTEQIANALKDVSLPDHAADAMQIALANQREQAAKSIDAARAKFRREVASLDEKINRLTVAYLEAGAFSAAEFRACKDKLLNEKCSITDKLTALDKRNEQRFEPLTRFINRSKQAKYIALTLDSHKLRTELEHVGSNLRLHERKFGFAPRGPWQLVVGQGSFAQHNAAPEISGAASVGESRLYPVECPRWESNPHGPLGPTDFTYHFGFRRPRCPRVRGLDYAFALPYASSERFRQVIIVSTPFPTWSGLGSALPRSSTWIRAGDSPNLHLTTAPFPMRRPIFGACYVRDTSESARGSWGTRVRGWRVDCQSDLHSRAPTQAESDDLATQ